MHQNNVVAQRIEALRLEHKNNKLGDGGWTTEKLAEKLGVDRSKIEAWGNSTNDRAPKPHELRQLCNLFNCDIGHLFGDYEMKKREFSDIQAFTGLSEHTINGMINAVSPEITGVTFINQLFYDAIDDLEFETILTEWVCALSIYFGARYEEGVFFSNDKKKLESYRQELHQLEPAQGQYQHGFTTRMDSHGYIDLRMRQIGDKFKSLMMRAVEAEYLKYAENRNLVADEEIALLAHGAKRANELISKGE